MLLLLVVAGVVYFLLAEPLDGVILMSFVVVVITISLYQEHKTETALTALRDLSSPRALVVRDGHQQRIAGRDVVRGDVALLAEGDRVPADGVLVDCVNLTVDESALTGEAVPVRKTTRNRISLPDAAAEEIGAGRRRHTLGVLRHARGQRPRNRRRPPNGRRTRRWAASGRRCAAIEPRRTPLQRELDRLVRIIAVCGVVAAAMVVIVFGWTRHDWLEGLLVAIGGAMAMLPEEIPVVLHGVPGARRVAHVPTSRPHAPLRSHRDPRIGHRDLRRQDRHPDPQHDGRRLAHRRRCRPPRRRRHPLPEAFPRARRIRGARLAARPLRSDGPCVPGVRRASPRRHRTPPRDLGSRPRIPAVRGPAGALPRVAITATAPTT